MALRTAPCHFSSLAAHHHAHALTGAAHGTQNSSVLMQQNGEQVDTGETWTSMSSWSTTSYLPLSTSCSCGMLPQ